MIFTISTLGCKVNQQESDIFAAALSAHGWRTAEAGERADVCVVNTCTVTGKASMQSRQLIRQLQRLHPGARIVVTGCYAQVAPEDIEAMDGILLIAGQSRKADLPDLIVQTVEGAAVQPLRAVDRLPTSIPFSAPEKPAPGTRTRPFLKIQDGCNSFCTYCIVPHARGRSRSMPPDQVIRHVRHLAEMGYHEVVLTGIHLGAYGLDLQLTGDLLSLMEALEKERPLARIRLSSIEPNELTDAIVDLVAESDMFCPHFHLPLQSGDDTILARMHRPYSVELFSQLVQRIKDRLPRAAVGADVLVGFPGEDDAAFERTYQLIERTPLTYLHVFPFSARPGTPAAGYPAQVPTETVKKRTARIRELGAAKKQGFMQSTLGQKAEALVENRRDPSTGCLKALTSNYHVVLLEGPDRHLNTLVPVEIQGIHDAGRLKGRIVS